MDDFFATNRRNWDERVPIHLRDNTGTYQIDAFLAGADTLYPIEASEIGDVSGKRLLHLQCHIGLDTLSLARRGAHATGLDFSPSAIEAARELARRTGMATRFVEGNVYDAATLAPEPFDIVYSTWGTVTWLPDVVRWAQMIAGALAPGGFFYLADDHPAAQMLEQIDGALVATYPWQTPADSPLMFEANTSYAGDRTELANIKSYQWIHPLSEILSALLDAGLSIEMLHEHDRLPWKPFAMMVTAGGGLYRLPPTVPAVPLALSLRARKR
jgi:2-polyprenyl-3-methyl-5-hydroxy-6-metoxy-1,4-benzoquinol methylase